MNDVLAAIVAASRRDLEVRAARTPRAVLEARAQARPAPRGRAFVEGLARTGHVNVIAECKRRSPSRGILRADYDPIALAGAYERGGAVAVSVLTEPSFFDGALAHLDAVRRAVDVPLLRKDFVVDPYQLAEACAHGADAVLLIVSALEDVTLRTLHRAATDMGLAVLVEVHDEAELARAVDAGARIVGVNNRNLRTLAVDPATSERIARALPDGVIAVSESGLSRADDVVRLQALGYSAFLVGERLMTSPDPEAALRALCGETPA